ncbi:lipopolysaccharide biosynthesis protein [Amycolatopsis sp. cg5]|uniref:lipopolysaccharide biosynthesis protein n=1 Tax=Amycolatopsis sp. cg5 TaxID=3238802 RepID=UPI003525B7E1
MSAVSDDLAKDTGKSAGKIGISLLIAIGLGYVLTFVCGRLLGPVRYDVFASFWAVLMGFGAALSPLEQELSRQSALASAAGHRVGRSAVRTFVVAAVVIAVLSLLTFIPQATTQLYGGQFWLAVIVLVGGVAFAFQFATRGLLIGHNEVRRFSGLILGEAGARVLVLGIVVAIGVGTQILPLALAAAAGSFAWLLYARPTAKLVDPHLEGEPWPVVVKRTLLLLLAAGLTASLVTGYPALVKLLAPKSDAEQLGAFFAALMVARVPLLLLSPLQALAVPTVVRLSASEEGHGKLRKLLVLGAIGSLVVAAIGAVISLFIGPWAVSLLFSAKFAAQGWWVAGLVWSSVMLTIMQLMAAVLVAQAKADKLVIVWAVTAVSAALTLVLMPGDTILRAVVGLIVGPTLGLAVVTAFVVRKPAPVG